MTSKISFSKFFKEQIKHNMALYIILSLCCLLRIITYLIEVQTTLSSGYFETLPAKQAYIVQALGTDSTLMAYGIVTGLMLAIGSFHFLHQKSASDLIHSLPIKRTKLFGYIVASDLIMVTIMNLITNILCSLICVAVGCFNGQALMNAFVSLICIVIITAMNYLTATLAINMTGNTFMSILAYVVFAAYIPLVIGQFYNMLASTFYNSYVSQGGLGFTDYLSPITLSFKLTRWHAFSMHGLTLIASILMIVFLFGITVCLFKIRPAEAASKSMAFKKTESIIRILLVIPLSIYGGLLLYSSLFTASKIWLIIGMILSAIILHGFIEGIYHFDVRAILKHKLQLLLCIAASLCILLFFWFDVTGFDNYQPEAEEVAYITVDPEYNGIGFLESNYHMSGIPENGVSGEDIPLLLEALKPAVRQAHEGSYSNIWISRNITIDYVLKNGKVKQRSYALTAEDSRDILKILLSSDTFKKSYLKLYDTDLGCITYTGTDYSFGNEVLMLSDQERSELIRAYLADYDKLTFETYTTEYPVSSLVLGIQAPDGENYGNNHYYIYPSFTNTLNFFEAHDIQVPITMEDFTITRINYFEDVNGKPESTASCDITDPDKIAVIQPHLKSLYSNDRRYWLSSDNEDDILLLDIDYKGMHYYAASECLVDPGIMEKYIILR